MKKVKKNPVYPGFNFLVWEIGPWRNLTGNPTSWYQPPEVSTDAR